jgi:hypothetical protein
MKTNKLVVTLILSLAAASAFAGGNGTAGANGAANGGNGVAEGLGYFPGWQTANPDEVAAEAAKHPQAIAGARSAPAEWPSWVHLAKAE